MDQETLWQQYRELPSDAQRQVIDFIAFLTSRYQSARSPRAVKDDDVNNEPIVGMWADRVDLTESSTWVRTLREREWDRPRG